MRKQILNQAFEQERALYALSDAEVAGCVFEGLADGESALKESQNVRLHNCRFALRYPLWHARNFSVSDSCFTETCRAPLWYTEQATLRHCRIDGTKALRESNDTLLDHCVIHSDEFGWKCRGLSLRDCELHSSYLFFELCRGEFSRLRMSGKYSFQYTEDLTFENCRLDTKDAFWHAKNVTVTDSVLSGEYLGWFSENLTLIRCHITGTQPFCYCKGLRLIDCTMEGTDLCFEYSDVEATIVGHVLSVKNPRSGLIRADSVGEIILEDSIMSTDCRIEITSEQAP